MITADAFIHNLRADGIRLWLDGDQLRYSSAKGPLQSSAREELSGRKEEIVLFLKLQRVIGIPLSAQSPRPGSFPLSIIQEQAQHRGLSLNCTNSIRLKGRLDTTALAHAFKEIVRRHEILRTKIIPIDAQPMLFPQSPGEARIEQVDLSGLKEPDRLETAAALSAETRSKRFDLSQELPVRFQLLVLSPDDHVLTLSIQHLMADQFSLDIFWAEMRKLYNAFCRDLPSPLSDPPIQFGDYAMWERKRFPSELVTQIQEHCSRLLYAPSANRLPLEIRRGHGTEICKLADFVRGPGSPEHFALPTMGTDNTGASHGFAIPAGRLRELAIKEAVTPLVVILSALKLVLSAWTGQEDITISNIVSIRQQRDLLGLIGFFSGLQHLRTKVADELTFRALIGAVRETMVHAMSWQMPYHFSVPRIYVNFIPYDPNARQDGEDLWPATQRMPGKTDNVVNVGNALLCMIFETESSFNFWFAYGSVDFQASTMKRLGEHLGQVLERFGDNLETPVAGYLSAPN